MQSYDSYSFHTFQNPYTSSPLKLKYITPPNETDIYTINWNENTLLWF